MRIGIAAAAAGLTACLAAVTATPSCLSTLMKCLPVRKSGYKPSVPTIPEHCIVSYHCRDALGRVKIRTALVDDDEWAYSLPPAVPNTAPRIQTTRHVLVFALDGVLVSSVVDKKLRRQRANYPASSLSIRQVFLRPGLEEFLAWCADRFELVLWTAAKRDHADAIVDNTLLRRFFAPSHRLYRDACDTVTICGRETLAKDLNRLGVPLSRVVMVDNHMSSFARQVVKVTMRDGVAYALTNGIYIDDFEAFDLRLHSDFYLNENSLLQHFLGKLVAVNDVRPVVVDNQIRTLLVERRLGDDPGTVCLHEDSIQPSITVDQ